MKSNIFQVVASALFFSTVQGHMVMKTPVPYGPPPNNSPLDPSGSDFPCKNSAYTVITENFMAIGEPQTLSFTGSAVHGGGSCQISLTTDRAPSKSSKWMVIKSIEGGCPSSVSGNLPADANGSGADKFTYTIPEGIAPGQYTIAWTWMNKIGNRELYMNCGAATITAAKKKRYAPQGLSLVRKQSSFPDMFVANLAGINSCTNTAGFDYQYPNPGAVVQTAGTGPYQQLTCGAAGGSNPAPAPAASAPVVAPSPSAPIASQNSAGSSTPSAAAPPAASPTQPGGLGGVFASVASSASTAPTSAPAASAPSAPAPVVSAAPVPSVPASAVPVPAAPAPSASAAPASGTSASQQTPGTACSPEGQWLCLGNSYQRCASGHWSPVMPLAAGMSCTPGMSGTLSQYAGKRSTSWVRRADSFRG